MTSKGVADFVSWVSKKLAAYTSGDTGEVADAVATEIMKIDERMGVEISSPRPGKMRELIITAYSESSLFPLVHQIVEALPAISGWHFIALKPPCGFTFSLSLGNQELKSNELEFAPIKEIDGGIQLLVPRKLFAKLKKKPDAEELAWLIVETGIGEELSAKLTHVEFADASQTSTERKISELAAFTADL